MDNGRLQNCHFIPLLSGGRHARTFQLLREHVTVMVTIHGSVILNQMKWLLGNEKMLIFKATVSRKESLSTVTTQNFVIREGLCLSCGREFFCINETVDLMKKVRLSQLPSLVALSLDKVLLVSIG